MRIANQHYYEGQARELQEWIERPREGKIDHMPLKPLSQRMGYWLGIWIEVILIFIVAPCLAYWFVEAVTK